MTAAVTKATERRTLTKLDLSPEVQQAFEWFVENITTAFEPVRDSLVAALEDGAIDPSTPTTIEADVRQIVRGFRGDVLIVFSDGSERGAQAGVDLAQRRFPISVSFDRPPERVLSEFEDWADEAVDSSLDTLTRDVTDLVYGAQEEGLSVEDTAEQVGDLMGDRYTGDESWRSDMISRTAVNSSSNSGSNAAYEDASSTVGTQWLATDDQRTRRTHRNADNQVVGFDTPFEVGGHEARFPADPTLPLSELINCRCTSIPVFSDDLTEDELATIQGGGRVWT